MNPADTTNTPSGVQPAAGIGLEDVTFTLFRHKWLILAFFCLGVVGAIGVRFLKKPNYVSKSQLMVHYVVNRPIGPAADGGQALIPDLGAQAIINTEVVLLQSLDVATNAAAIITPARLLAKSGGGNDLMSAAGIVSSGLEVENPPHTAILTVSYKNRDPELVQPVLQALITAYKRKHNSVHGGDGELDETYARQRDELAKKLSDTEADLKKLENDAGIVSLEESKQSLQSWLAKWQDELLTAQIQLAEGKAIAGEAGNAILAAQSNHGSEGAAVPTEKIEEYSVLLSDLAASKRNEHELKLHYQDAYPTLRIVLGQIEAQKAQKAALEKEFPALAHMAIAATAHSSTNSVVTGIPPSLTDLKALNARVSAISDLVTNLQAKASSLLALEPKINQLVRQRNLEETNYLSLTTALRQALVRESAPGNNISIVEQPTPPDFDRKKLMKLVGAVFAGCVACGLGLAFLIDFVFDRTIKRSSDVERHLGLPVFLSIPDSSWTGRVRLPFGRGGASEKRRPALAAVNGNGHDFASGTTALTSWSPAKNLQTFTEGLRERVITYFELKNMGLKKPKLVGVTGCGHGSGVSTLASGFAAALSTTGDGNVLLVDMNAEQGVAHSYYKGKPGCGLTDVLRPDGRVEAQIQDNLFLASAAEGTPDKLTKAAPTGFNHLVPKLKASDYDYIIFDMPPVSPSSPTPRLASHMDITLLVLESEKTGQHLAARASALMRESRANVAAVLNKYRPHVPARLSQEL